jgi:hypothetical protein
MLRARVRDMLLHRLFTGLEVHDDADAVLGDGVDLHTGHLHGVDVIAE